MIPAKEFDGELWIRAADHHQAIKEALAQQQDNPHPEYCKGYAAGLEAGAISEKKPAQPEQEPVAYIHRQGNHWEVSERFLSDDEKSRGWTEEPLYTTPLAQPEQEPVAWMWRCKPYCDWPEWSVSLKRPADSGRDGHKRTKGYEDVPLYTTPPQRTWVGLTDEEIETIYANCNAWDKFEYERMLEAKLKEKNT